MELPLTGPTVHEGCREAPPAHRPDDDLAHRLPDRRQPAARDPLEVPHELPQPSILRGSGEGFSPRGTAAGRGARVFALTGRVRNTGRVEVAMGTSIRAIVYGIGGGPREGRRIKAVQIGGPAGGCLPERLFDLPIDDETLAGPGTPSRPGSLVVMDERTCMVDAARSLLEPLLERSCGRCVPCRVGLRRMLEIVKNVMGGRCARRDLELLADLAETTAGASLCSLGQTASNPVLTALRYFEEEFLAHVEDQRCPAGVCRGLSRHFVDRDP